MRRGNLESNFRISCREWNSWHIIRITI